MWKNSAVFVTRMPSSSPVEGDIIEVSCGSLKGKLHKNKFYCPGIHRECIEQSDGKFISPKIFTIMGEKERLKDWKNAVRINGLQLRRYIDSGQLDFYRHDEYCTGRCVARTPIVHTDKPLTVALANRRRSTTVSSTIPPDFPLEKKLVRSPVPKVEFVGSINEHTYCHLPDDSERSAVEQDIKPDVTVLQNFLQRKTESFTKPAAETTTSNGMKDMSVGVDDNLLSPEEITFPIELTPVDGSDSSYEDDKNFWTGIMEFGFLDVFMVDIKDHITLLRKDLVVHARPEDCHKLSVIVRALGLMDKFKKKMSNYKINMEKQEAKLEREMEELKSQVAIFERRKEALKRKSEKFKSLLQINTKNECVTDLTTTQNSSEESKITPDVSSTVSTVPRQETALTENVKTNNEAEKMEIRQHSPTAVCKNKSFVKKVLLTSIPSDQKNDLKHVTVTIARLKQCLENNKKVPASSVTETIQLMNSVVEGSSTITEKSVYIPPQVTTSDDTSEAEGGKVDTTSDSQVTGNAAAAETSDVDESSGISENLINDDADEKPKPKRLRLGGTVQKTNNIVTDKLRDKLKAGNSSVDEYVTNTKEKRLVNNDDSTTICCEPKKRKVVTVVVDDKKNDVKSNSTKENTEQQPVIPFYGVKKKTVTEIIVSKEVAEKAKHILRGANEVLTEVVKKKGSDDSKSEKTLKKADSKMESVEVMDSELGTKTEISCQTPLDGVREKVVESGTSMVASRRSTRKTPHLFTWGSKVDVVKKVL